MTSHGTVTTRGRRVTLAGLLAFIAAVAVATAWFQEESKWNGRWAVLMLGGFALASAIVCLNSPSLTAASIRMAVGSALLLVSVAWSRFRPEAVGWHYSSVYHWLGYWALATVALPWLLGPGLSRAWIASGRERWVGDLKQVPRGFLLFLLAILLSFALMAVLDLLVPSRPRPIARTRFYAGSTGRSGSVAPRAGLGAAPPDESARHNSPLTTKMGNSENENGDN